MKENKDIISSEIKLLDALKLMDDLRRKLLFILADDKRFVGVLSLGDIQRAIINKKPFETPVSQIMRKIITVAYVTDSFESIKKTMIEKRTEAMPIIDENGYLKKIIYWEDILEEHILSPKEPLNLPVVIMAGGKGTRLKPLTNVIPKPLIPIGDKTIVEEIMDRFIAYGCDKFFMSVNYRSEMLKYYLETQTDKKYDVFLFQEDKPLGTAGSLNLLKGKINTTFFVSNCDILVDDDYSEILKYHRQNKNELTIVAALKSYRIPYGTIETKADGLISRITEKPEVTFNINTGLYILEPHLIDEIPENEFFHITGLIEELIKNNRRVGVFPVSENSWTDIGEWKEYLKLINE
jgi:dTDP-glucose pyrophosphorylase